MFLVINGVEYMVDEQGNRTPVPPTRLQQLEEFQTNIRRLVERHLELASAESHHYFELLDELVQKLRTIEEREP